MKRITIDEITKEALAKIQSVGIQEPFSMHMTKKQREGFKVNVGDKLNKITIKDSEENVTCSLNPNIF